MTAAATTTLIWKRRHRSSFVPLCSKVDNQPATQPSYQYLPVSSASAGSDLSAPEARYQALSSGIGLSDNVPAHLPLSAQPSAAIFTSHETHWSPFTILFRTALSSIVIRESPPATSTSLPVARARGGRASHVEAANTKPVPSADPNLAELVKSKAYLEEDFHKNKLVAARMADTVDEVDRGGDDGVDVNSRSEHDPSRDTAVPDLATPQQLGNGFFVLPSGSLSRPTTRSISRFQSVSSVTESGPKTDPKTELLSRLRSASSKASGGGTASSLEDSRDIKRRGEGDEEEKVMEEVVVRPPTKKRKLTTSNELSTREQSQTATRRSARINPQNEDLREGTPQVAELNSAGGSARSKHRKPPVKPRRMPLRRSARLSKPLTEFHMYANLPPELKICVWEAAVTPRVVYIRNRASIAWNFPFTNDVQNSQPKWFMTTKISAEVAKSSYVNMFALHSPDDDRTSQVVNPETDIIILEPCCSGCRGHYCTRHQFSDDDRSAVRSMAVQTEPRGLPLMALPCWESISNAWRNLETLYLMKEPLRGNHKEEKAILRITEESREVELRKKFDEWKKGNGKDKKITKLEFVVVVNKETEPKALKNRYKDVKNRNTGLPEDVIIG
ncbi:uncharacterized protein BCR38DRAFT_404719 [Pseudomassariella vexata]|uniref:2EXR domain-containing protein n=1 Tax=Pseudomassariella vexata TaxID=1141098 RepID=A0A1Y2EJC4_9PEZI|nr:uncharacterized protein BCR38DRAFT_404719 [Pseudomassariella vexata]ORY71660.1 hypothetical protein BCR38DRAFT_404719 [Pseudomassariella vexata]